MTRERIGTLNIFSEDEILFETKSCKDKYTFCGKVEKDLGIYYGFNVYYYIDKNIVNYELTDFVIQLLVKEKHRYNELGKEIFHRLRLRLNIYHVRGGKIFTDERPEVEDDLDFMRSYNTESILKYYKFIWYESIILRNKKIKEIKYNESLTPFYHNYLNTYTIYFKENIVDYSWKGYCETNNLFYGKRMRDEKGENVFIQLPPQYEKYTELIIWKEFSTFHDKERGKSIFIVNMTFKLFIGDERVEINDELKNTFYELDKDITEFYRMQDLMEGKRFSPRIKYSEVSKICDLKTEEDQIIRCKEYPEEKYYTPPPSPIPFIRKKKEIKQDEDFVISPLFE